MTFVLLRSEGARKDCPAARNASQNLSGGPNDPTESARAEGSMVRERELEGNGKGMAQER